MLPLVASHGEVQSAMEAVLAVSASGLVDRLNCCSTLQRIHTLDASEAAKLVQPVVAEQASVYPALHSHFLLPKKR